MIKLSNGHELKYVVASGALAFDGKGWFWEWPLVWLGIIKPELFTVVIKTLTRHPRPGNLRWWNPWTCMRLIRGGSVNKIGLTNKGIDWWCKEIAPFHDFVKFPLIASIFGTKEELVEMTKMLNRYPFVAIKVNYSCPNSGDALQDAGSVVDAVKAVKEVSGHPVIVKVSVDQDYLTIASDLEGIAEAIALNSIPWKTAFPDGEETPLWRLEKKVGGGGGGVSGKPAQKLNWRAAEQLYRQGSLPVIVPSVMNYQDVVHANLILKAAAISFGAIHLRTPWRPTAIVEELNHQDQPTHLLE